MVARRKARSRKPISRWNAEKKSQVLAALAQQLGAQFSGVSSRYDLEGFAATLERSVWLYVATIRVAQALAGVELKVVDRDTKKPARGLAAKDLRKLLRRVNDEDTQFDLLESQFIHLGLDGEAICHKAARGALGRPVELRVLRPADMKALPDTTGARRIGGWLWSTATAEIPLRVEDVIFCKTYNPNDPIRGFSPVTPVKRDICWDIEACMTTLAIIKRGMRNSGIFTPRDGIMLSDDQWDALEATLQKKNAGSKNAGNALLLPAPFDYKADNMTPKDADLLPGRRFAREIITAPSGATPMMVGNYESASYANSEQQTLQFWDGVGKPNLTKLLGAMNEQLVEPDFDDEIEISVDFRSITSQLDGQKALVDKATKLLSGTIITINEARGMLGMEDAPDGDKFLMQGAFVLVDPDHMVNEFAHPSNNQPQPAGQSGDGSEGPGDVPLGEDQHGPPSNGKKPPQAPAAAPATGGAKGSAHVGNGKTHQHFADATPVLARLRGNCIRVREKFLRNMDLGQSPFQPDQSVIPDEVSSAIVDSLGQIAQSVGNLPAPLVREVLSKSAGIRNRVLSETSNRITESNWISDQAERSDLLDPMILASKIWGEIVREMVDCVKALADRAPLGGH